MARPPDPRIRARLRNDAVHYVLTHGIHDLALRPLARALKTNARMLVYHFGSREGLMREILFGIRELGDARIRAWFDREMPEREMPNRESKRKTLKQTVKRQREAHSMADFLRWYWKQVSGPEARPLGRLVFELYALALRYPKEYPGVLEAPLPYWKELTKKTAKRSKAAEAEATLLLAATRGLLLDLCATGDRARTEKALDLLVQLIESRGA